MITPRAKSGQACDDCGVCPKHCRSIFWFKGKFRCNVCVAKATEFFMNGQHSQQVIESSNASSGFIPQVAANATLPALTPADTHTKRKKTGGLLSGLSFPTLSLPLMFRRKK